MQPLTLPAQALDYARRRGVRSTVASLLEHLNARWHLRGATTLGTVRLRGRARVVNQGTMTFADRVRLEGQLGRLHFYVGPHGTLEVGEGTFINYSADIASVRAITIGRNVLIGPQVIILDTNFHDIGDRTRSDAPSPVVIEDDVWIGTRVTVLPGSHIGAGAVIGAHAVVNGVIPPRTFAGGVPARVIRSLDD
ncbi:MAG: acyltransferase [Dehalococcoidia bacterium]|nr:acyltransferase [Dehalococcoidia bacterium]